MSSEISDLRDFGLTLTTEDFKFRDDISPWCAEYYDVKFDKKEGIAITFDRGKLSSICTYVDGVKHGPFYVYGEAGGYFENGDITEVIYV